MTLPRRRHALSPAALPAPAVPAIIAADSVTASAIADDWRRAVDTLAATAHRRDGDNAARHTEIRRRMRALARAARTLARGKAD